MQLLTSSALLPTNTDSNNRSGGGCFPSARLTGTQEDVEGKLNQ